MLRLFLSWFTLLFCVLPTAAAQDGGPWTRQLETPEAFQVTALVQEVAERHGGRLRIEAGRLMRTWRKRESELGCSSLGGPGLLCALAADPFGLTFVASSSGLFVTSPESESLHHVRLRAGAPTEAPGSLLFDQQRRLWLAGKTQFGVLEVSHYYGRRIEPPAPGPYMILGLREQQLFLRCGEEIWSYDIDAGPRGSIGAVSREGQALVPGATIEMTYGDKLALDVQATAAGGAEVRYALDGNHVWNPLFDAGPEFEPGEHRLALVALDRDLRFSRPFELQLRVLYPFYYRTRFVLGSALLLALLFFGLFFVQARRQRQSVEEGLPAALPRAVLSMGLFLVLGLQVLAGAIPHGRGWPFIGYSMYTESADVGHISHNGVIVGFGKRGVPLPIPLGTLGMAADNRWQLLRPIMNSDAVAAQVIEKYNTRHPDWEQVRRIQVWAKRTLIRKKGALQIAPLILSDFKATGPEAVR